MDIIWKALNDNAYSTNPRRIGLVFKQIYWGLWDKEHGRPRGNPMCRDWDKVLLAMRAHGDYDEPRRLLQDIYRRIQPFILTAYRQRPRRIAEAVSVLLLTFDHYYVIDLVRTVVNVHLGGFTDMSTETFELNSAIYGCLEAMRTNIPTSKQMDTEAMELDRAAWIILGLRRIK
jgi:hypothetical protein